MMYRVQQNHLRSLSKEEYWILKKLTRWSKNVYNHTLWLMKEEWKNKKKFLLYKKAYPKIKTNEYYQRLPAQMAQQSARRAEQAYKSFFSLMKAKKQGKYTELVKEPCFLPKEGFFLLSFTPDYFKVQGKTIRLSLGRWITKNLNKRFLRFSFPCHLGEKEVKEVRILPRSYGMYFEIEFVYNRGKENLDIDVTKSLGIDLGLDNFATIVDTDGTAFIIEGRGIKSFNRWWNKKKAELQKKYDKQGIKTGTKMMKLERKRRYYLRNFMAQAVNEIIKHCKTNNIGTIVIGEMKNIKKHCRLGKRTTQNFHYITYGLFKHKLRTKSELYGIDYKEIDEAYSSQTCSQCGQIRKANRKYRGLYVCKNCGTVLNADVNGAINILKKVAPESSLLKIGGSGRLSRPSRRSVVPQHSYV